MMEYRSRSEGNIVYGPPLNFSKDDDQGLGYFFYQNCRKYADKIFQIDGKTGRAESYSNVLQKSIRTALEMTKMGIKEGDVITIYFTNNMNSVVPIIAATFLNVVVANLDPTMSVRDCVYLLNLVRPKIIFFENMALDSLEKISQQLTCKPELVSMESSEKYIPFSQFLAKKKNENEFVPVLVRDTNSVSVMFFSSGTTGMPKPVKCSHHGLLHSMRAMKQMELCPKVTFHVSSFYWISAYIITLLTVECGGHKVIASGFDPTFIVSLIHKYKITFAFLASNFAYHFTKENTSEYDTSSVQNILFGGSSVSDEQIKKCKSYFPNGLVTLCYGQTEASNYITVFSKAQTSVLAEKYPGSSGVLLPGSALKVVDPDTEEIVPPNSLGEIRLRHGGLFVGYYNDDASTAIDSEGFLKTGDLGYLNEEHCLYITDRLKDMFKFQSWHIVPASVEKVICQHPAVKEALVLGIPHPEDGDHPIALVRLKEGYLDIKEEDIQTFVNARVLDREKLRAGVKIVHDFPRTVTGKIVRRQVRKAVIEGTL